MLLTFVSKFSLKDRGNVSDFSCLLGPCLFWWCAEENDQLIQFWENYILIMETLEGNQVNMQYGYKVLLRVAVVFY